MVETVTTAVYKVETRGAESIDALAAGLDALAISEEKVTRATRTTEQGFDRMRAKLDPAVKAHQDYQRAVEAVARYEADGIGTAQERARVIDLATQKYLTQVAALERAALAQDKFNRAAAQAPSVNSAAAINQRLGVSDDFGAAGRAADIAAYGAALDRLQAKYDPLFAAGLKYKTALEGINEAERVGAIAASTAIRARLDEASSYNTQVAAIERVAAARKAAAQAAVNQQTIVPDRGADISAYGRQLDDLRAKYNPLYAAGRSYRETLTEINQAVRVGAINEKEHAAAVQRTKDAFAQHVVMLKSDTQAMVGLSQQTRQTLVQLPDIIQGIGGGQSVFQVVLQQGGQLVQLYGMSPQGVGGSLKQVAAEMMAFITPARLLAAATVGAGVAAYAAYAYWKSYTLQLDDTARAAGTSTRELSKLQAAASFKGISASDFNTGIGSFATTIYQARNNMGGLAEVLHANGVPAVRDFEDGMSKAANLIRHARDDQQRLVLLQQMGLPATMEWVRLLSGGADGLKRAKNEAAEFAADDRLIRQAREFDEAWNKAWANFGLNARAAIQGAMSLGSQFMDLVVKLTMMVPVLGQNVPTNMLRNAYSTNMGGTRLTNDSSVSQFYDPLGSGAPKGKQAIDPAVLQRQLALQQQYVGILGQTATVEQSLIGIRAQLQQYALTPGAIQLTEKQKDAIIEVARQQALGTLQIKAQADAYSVEAATIGMSVAQATAYAAAQNVINQAKLQGKPLTAENIAEIQREAEELGKLAQKAAEARLSGDIKFNFDTAFLSDADKQIASILRQVYGDNKWQSMMDGPIAGAIRLNTMMADVNQTIRSSASGFANDLVSGIMSGKSAMESLQGAATSLGKSLTQAGINNIIKDPLSPVGYVEAGIGVLAQMFGGADESKKKLEQAQKVWKEAGPAFEQFLTQMSGGVQGELMSKIASARQNVSDLGNKAWEAGDYAAVTRIVNAYREMYHRAAQNFIATMAATEQGLADGLGMDSPFLKAVDTVKTQLASVQAFIDDVRTSTGLLSGALSEDTLALTGDASAIAYMNGEIAKASGVAQTYLLSLLGSTPQLSTVATRMLDIQGRAAALQGALEQLGMSSGAAAAAIAGGVQKAIDDLRKSFESGLTSRLNVATGKGYLNDTLTLLAQRNQDVADAAKLGLDMNLVSTVFAAEAQKIVDDAGLVGDAFTSFITIFPELSGVVSQSRTEIEKAATELQTFMQQTAKTITSYLQGLKTGASSTLSPQAQLAEAQSYFNAQLALAQGGNRDALSNITQVAQTLLDQAKSFYASSGGYASIYDQVTAALHGLVGTTPQTAVSADARAIITSIDTNAASADNLATMQNTLAAQQLSYLQVQQSLLSAIRDLTNSNVEQITLLRTALNPGSVSVNVPPAEGRSNVTLSNQMVEALNKIAWNTYATAKNTQTALGLDHDYYSGYGGLYARGGVIPGYAAGGMIANGLYGIDSVVARLPNGRPIGLAGGEGVLTASATQAIGGGAMIDYINRNLRLPTNDNGASSRENFRALAQWNRADADRIVAKLDEVLAALEVAPQRTSDATRRVVAAMKSRAIGG